MTHTDYDEADQIRACTRKKGYPTEEIAKTAAASIRRTNLAADVRPYGCRRCGQWHVGGSPGSPAPAAPAREDDAEEDEWGAPVGRERRRPTRIESYGDGYSRDRKARARGR